MLPIVLVLHDAGGQPGVRELLADSVCPQEPDQVNENGDLMFRRMLIVATIAAAPVLGIPALAALPAGAHPVGALCPICAAAPPCPGAGKPCNPIPS